MPASELPIDVSADAAALAASIFDDSVSIMSASYEGDELASGIYSNGEAISEGVVPGDTGIILSTGQAQDFTNSSGQENQATNTTTNNPDGIDGDGTFDGAFLNVDFIPDNDMMTMQFVFASEEYPEFQNAVFQDFFGVWINGVRVPLDVGDSDVDPGNVNSGSNENLYNDNTSDQFNTEFDGFTVTMSLKMDVNPGLLNSIRIGIADVADAAFDSAVLIAANSVQTDFVAVSDAVTVGPSATTVIDVLDNDIATSGGSLLRITHINDVEVSAGSIVELTTGQTVQLNADSTITLIGDGDVEDYSFTYRVDNFLNNDVAFVNVTTVPCFVVGTMIATPDGEVPVEKLAPGDLVLTRDDGPQPVRWAGDRVVAAQGDLAPIRIQAGAFGDHRQLMVSPQHRVLLQDEMAELMFGATEVLVAAKDLLNDHSVTRVTGGTVRYVHLLFDRHQVIRSQGFETESLLPGPQSTKMFAQESIDEICAIFPELDPDSGTGYPTAARLELRSYEAAVLLQQRQVA